MTSTTLGPNWYSFRTVGDDNGYRTRQNSWRMRLFLDPTRLPKHRTTVEFRATGRNGGVAWLVINGGEGTVCQIDPGYEVDLRVCADNEALHRWFMGRVELRDETTAGRIRLEGQPRLIRAFPTWFVDSPLNDDIRRHAEAERRGSLIHRLDRLTNTSTS